MSPTALVLIGYSLLAVALVVALTSWRSFYIVLKGRPANDFNPDGSDVIAPLQRLTRVYANVSESAPAVLLPLIVALALGATHITDDLAWLFLAARLLQTLTHLVSASDTAVRVRYAFFMIQVGLSVFWSFQLLLLIAN